MPESTKESTLKKAASRITATKNLFYSTYIYNAADQETLGRSSLVVTNDIKNILRDIYTAGAKSAQEEGQFSLPEIPEKIEKAIQNYTHNMLSYNAVTSQPPNPYISTQKSFTEEKLMSALRAPLKTPIFQMNKENRPRARFLCGNGVTAEGILPFYGGVTRVTALD